MKKSVKLFLKTVLTGILCSGVFISLGYFYLENRLNTPESESKSAVKSEEGIPYYESLPENAGVLFDFGGSLTLCYLDFEGGMINVISAENYELDKGRIAGYTVDYTVRGDYSLLSGIIDRLGGIDYELEDGVFSLTGIQVTELISVNPQTEDCKNKVTEKIFLKISENGFEKEDFLYIIENSETNLSVPDCYYWADYVKELCYNVRYIR